MGLRSLIILLASLIALTVTTGASGELNQADPCLPESVFDKRCDEDGGGDIDGDDRCFENCRICEMRNNRFGCYSTFGAGSCSCYTDFDNLGNLFCSSRGRCSVMV